MVSKEKIFEAVSTVIDPEVGFNLVEMGLIYDAFADPYGYAKVTMTLSTKACPLHQMIVQWVKEAVEKLDDIKTCTVELVWEPEWNASMADESVRNKLAGIGGS